MVSARDLALCELVQAESEALREPAVRAGSRSATRKAAAELEA